MTLTLTNEMQQTRQAVSLFATLVPPPVDIRQCLTSVLRDDVPAEVDAETIGWTLTAVSGALLRLAGMAQEAGASPSEVVIAPRMLAALCSAAEAFITDAELPSLDD